MNPLIKGLFKKFREEEELIEISDADAFELFAASLILPEDLLSQVQKSDLLLDQGAIGVDVIALDVNGQLAWDADDVREICDNAAKVEVSLHFIQAKQSASVSSAEILSFGDTVRKFLQNEGFPAYPRLDSLAKALGSVFENYASRLKDSPSIYLYFTTTAPKQAISADPVRERIATATEHIDNLGFLGKVVVTVLGADDIHDAWVRKNHANEVEIQFEKQVNLPKMPGVDQAILGVVSVAELLKLIQTGEEKNLDERVFYDNVRGFKGEDNSVNKQIMSTLDSAERSLLPVLNNGVTVVAASYSPKPGDAVAVSGYQIVNGCQTSHCLYLSKQSLGDAISEVYVPIRLVVTGDEEVATQIIRATNSQTAVQENDLVALSKFQKRLEDFYKLDTPDIKLTYERRSGQFYNKEVTKNRIVTISDQMRAVSAMFLDAPHVAARYASRLYADIGEAIFREDHKLLPYMASAFAAYRLENAFRSGGLESAYKPARYHILMALKYHVLGGQSTALDKNKSEEQSEQIIVALKQQDLISTFRELAQSVIAAGGGQMPSRDRLKRQQFTQELVTELMKS
ncbi:AIPR family protein [Streptomyces heilongjiangensis]|uniref:AIPR family protein n=1 Tax=Streptomyces heilongjiangensis TaxID=945052 RepID=A0ABW1BF52_9ACTN|nr:AIPR family protein [Streptomyces heilongjiangensis]MDC2950662.1 AIPR family protein [Streptomyces heilongjiangensis]